MADVTLKVNGREYGGWKSARVTRGIESIAGSFELTVSERWANQRTPWPFAEGDECSVAIGGVVLITGFVFKRSPRYSRDDHGVSVSGRDKTGDLVDCSVYSDKWEFKELTLLKFAEKLCEPHGIKVSMQAGLSSALPKPPKKHAITPGVKVFHALEEACRLAGVLPVSDGKGGVVLTRSSTDRASVELVEGENILTASAVFDSSERFHTYHVIGQHHGSSDDFFGEDAASVKASAEDSNIKRTSRVLVVRPEHNVTPELAKKRAQWEATTRAARGDTVTVTVQGWTQGSKKPLWPINALARVRSPEIGVNGDMLITQAEYGLGDREGTTTTLTLRRPDAFKPEPSGVSGDRYWKEIVKGV
jgi:prophage tail gpP-like protein